MLRAAKLWFPTASLGDIDSDEVRKLDRVEIARMSDASLVADGRNLFIIGMIGVGNSWFASAFGSATCRLGKRVSMHRTSRLLDDLCAACSDGT